MVQRNAELNEETNTLTHRHVCACMHDDNETDDESGLAVRERERER